MNKLHEWSAAESQVLKDFFDKKLAKNKVETNLECKLEFIDIDSIFEYNLPDAGTSNIEV